MADLLERGDGRDIQRKLAVFGNGPDSALAENDVVVAFRHDVLSHHEELIQMSGP